MRYRNNAVVSPRVTLPMRPDHGWALDRRPIDTLISIAAPALSQNVGLVENVIVYSGIIATKRVATAWRAINIIGAFGRPWAASVSVFSSPTPRRFAPRRENRASGGERRGRHMTRQRHAFHGRRPRHKRRQWRPGSDAPPPPTTIIEARPPRRGGDDVLRPSRGRRHARPSARRRER